MVKRNPPKRFFWTLLLIGFLLSAGQILATSANTQATDLVINEFMAANGSGLTDEDGDYSDWIEIYNRSDWTVNLAGWALTNDPNQPQQWPFPDISLGSHDYLLVFASGKNRRSTEAGAALHTNFKLDKSGEFLALHNVLESRFMDALSPQFSPQFRDIAYGRYGPELAFGYLSQPTPGSLNNEAHIWADVIAPLEFSSNRGFYETPLTVALTTATPGATIRYTTDGTEPTEGHGLIYTEPIRLETTTLLRTIAFKPAYLPVKATHTYLFLDEVVARLESLVGGSAGTVAQFADIQPGIKVLPSAAAYESAIAPIDVSTTWAELKASLTSIPSLSLVMAEQTLADLQAHAQSQSQAAEYPVSVELIDPDGQQLGFQINAGIAPHPTAMVAGSSPKPSFQLFFKSKYGASKLTTPLLPDSGVEAFDSLLLEAGPDFNPGGQDQTGYIRNAWLRASQIAMSNLGPHGRFVHLYLNGSYEGLYTLAESPDPDFMASYGGGQAEDWFMADQDGPLTPNLGAQAGRLHDLFTALPLFSRLDLGHEQLTLPENIEEIYAVAASYLDATYLIDFLILNEYAQRQGWPMNSWQVVIHRQDQPGRGRIFMTGQQAALNSAEEKAQRDLVNLLRQVAMQNPDFSMEFADRMYKHLANNGVLTEANAQGRWAQLQQTIEPALIAEAVRWGASGPGLVTIPPESRADQWLTMARQAGDYPPIDPPLFNQEGGLVEAGFGLTMALSSPACDTCIIYYTTDNTDPRLPVTGAVMPTAKPYDTPVILTTTTHLKARVWAGSASTGVWSALHEVTFEVVEQDNRLRITEIMYNPTGGDDYEFIEVQNMGASPLDLTNFSLDEGIRFAFPVHTPPLAPGEFAVLVSNPLSFAERYPEVAISGVYDGHLSNKGEKVVLKDADGQGVIAVEYNDEYGWPVSADGRGDSLILLDGTGNANDPLNWRASTYVNGSPGAAEPGTDY